MSASPKAPGPARLCRKLGYRFKDPGILAKALRHASFVNEQTGKKLEDNERLEFLGDAVLGLAVSHLLMEHLADAEEGRLSKLRAMIVDEAGLHRVARDLDLGKHMLLGRGEEQSDGRGKPSILSGAVEALFGAIYLDGGFQEAFNAAHRLFGPLVKNSEAVYTSQDFKSMLQEFTQRKYRSLPAYRLERETGSAHAKTFRVELTIDGRVISSGEGKNKKEAEQRAAENAFRTLTDREKR